MSDLVGNPEDRFSQNEAHFARTNSLFATEILGPKFLYRTISIEHGKLSLKEQSDQGNFHLHCFDETPSGLASLFEF